MSSHRNSKCTISQESPSRLCEKILIGMTGSVGATLLPHYVLYLRQHYVSHVKIIMSRAAQRFITPYTMTLYSGEPVVTDLFDHNERLRVPHMDLTRNIDLLLIMPATASIISKAAHGACDDLISTAIVACEAPVVFVPSMNQAMWFNRAVQRNVTLLRDLGYYIIEPGPGHEIGDLRPTFGVMPPLEDILTQLRSIVTSQRNNSPTTLASP
jgi:phosphopantothenoylcysteine decarboxylase/phosphopantothenate--cysteine ligase